MASLDLGCTPVVPISSQGLQEKCSRRVRLRAQKRNNNVSLFFVSTYFARSAGCRPSRRLRHKSCPGHRREATMFLFFCIHIFRKECRVSAEPTPMAQVLSRAHDKEETFWGLFFLFLNIGVGVSFFFIFAVSDYLEYVMQVTISVLLLQRDSFSCVWMNTL